MEYAKQDLSLLRVKETQGKLSPIDSITARLFASTGITCEEAAIAFSKMIFAFDKRNKTIKNIELYSY